MDEKLPLTYYVLSITALESTAASFISVMSMVDSLKSFIQFSSVDRI